ncbi:glycosyltransferase family 39 protein [Kitasatospora kifunensis]|uniref:Mannosyltransferase n=1 Tax=Kitasatospora kifunensis TaxID=58351 RepID=A0A7W7R4W9_KITKI|nr:glycosyltransferase family 39 protein [Kitasatospora kifunensis]MBB4925279.1 mannosyltransferase [Kitasatospora kifunensis]
MSLDTTDGAADVTENASARQAWTGGDGPVRRALRLASRAYWLWPALLTLAVCRYHGDRVGLWRDELATWSAINRSNGQLIDLLKKTDAVTGTYYFLLKGWAAVFGHSVITLRMPSMLAMAGAAAFIGLIGRQLFGKRVGVAAGLLFAFIPSITRYGQEARGYAFAVLLVTAATWLLLRVLERPRVGAFLGYGLCLAGAGLFHLVAMVVVVSHGAIVLLRWRTSRDRRLLVGFALGTVLALVLLIPLIIIGQREVHGQLGWLGAPTFGYIASPFFSTLFASTWVSYGVFILACLPLAWSRGRRPAAELALIAVLPIVLVWIVSQKSPYFLDRYLLFTVPFWALLAAAGAMALRPRVVGALALIMVVLSGVQDQQQVRKWDAREFSDSRAAAAFIAKNYQPGDAIAPESSPVVDNNYWVLQLDTALRLYLPSHIQPRDVFEAATPVQANSLYLTQCPLDQSAACLGTSAPRVWVVTVDYNNYPFDGFPKEQVKALQAEYPKQTVTRLAGSQGRLMVTLMEK